MLDKVFASGERFAARAVPVHLAGRAEARFSTWLYEPVRDAYGEITGIFVRRLRRHRSQGDPGPADAERGIAAADDRGGRDRHLDLDLLSDTLDWSARTKAMFGLSPQTPCSLRDFYAGLHPDDREAATAAFARALDPAQRAPYDVEYRTIGKEDGVLRWVAAKGKGLFATAGACYRAVGTVIDITARKRNEARQAFMLQLSDLLRASTPTRRCNR